MCTLDDFQRLRFDNFYSPDKITGKPKIVCHPKSSQEILKHKSTFTFILRTIYEVNGTAQYLRRLQKPNLYSYSCCNETYLSLNPEPILSWIYPRFCDWPIYLEQHLHTVGIYFFWFSGQVSEIVEDIWSFWHGWL